MKVHWPCFVAFGIVATAFLFQSARVWFLERRNVADQDKLKRLRLALRSSVRVLDSGPRVSCVDCGKVVGASAAKHDIERGGFVCARCWIADRPVDAPPVFVAGRFVGPHLEADATPAARPGEAADASLDRPAASAGTVGGLVGGSVFLAYYHTGFTDDPPKLLDVCDSEASAADVIEAHKRDRDRDCEYKDKATWWTKARAVRTANAAGQTPAAHKEASHE